MSTVNNQKGSTVHSISKTYLSIKSLYMEHMVGLSVPQVEVTDTLGKALLSIL